MKTAVANRNAAIDAVTADIGTGSIKFYTGAAPTHPEDSPTGSLLATLAMSANYASASAGSAAATGWTPNTAGASGTVGYYRILDSGAVVVCQGSCGLTGSGAGIEFDVTAWTSGGTVSLTSHTISMGEGTTT